MGCLLAVVVGLTSAAPSRATGAEPVARASSGGAATANSSRLAVLPVEISGGEDASLGSRIRAHLQSGLARGAFALVDAVDVERLAPEGCDARCLAALGRATGATFALRARITVSERDYRIRLELMTIKDAAVVATSEERCDVCGRDEMGTLVETQAALLRRKLEDLIQGPPVLVLTSEPSGALVYIDDELVGQTPLERTSIAGAHVLRLALDGYAQEQRPLNLATGVRETLAVPLRRLPGALRGRALGWGSLGLGVPVAAAGLVLLVLDGTQIRSNCSSDDLNRDIEGRCRYIYDTDWGGAVALAAGAALVAIGVTLLRVNRSKHTRKRVKLEAAGLGLRGRF